MFSPTEEVYINSVNFMLFQDTPKEMWMVLFYVSKPKRKRRKENKEKKREREAMCTGPHPPGIQIYWYGIIIELFLSRTVWCPTLGKHLEIFEELCTLCVKRKTADIWSKKSMVELGIMLPLNKTIQPQDPDKGPGDADWFSVYPCHKPLNPPFAQAWNQSSSKRNPLLHKEKQVY